MQVSIWQKRGLGRKNDKCKGPEVSIWQFERQRGGQVLKQSEKGKSGGNEVRELGLIDHWLWTWL